MRIVGIGGARFSETRKERWVLPTILQIARSVSAVTVSIRGQSYPLRMVSDLETMRIAEAVGVGISDRDGRARAVAAICALHLDLEVDGKRLSLAAGEAAVAEWAKAAADQVRDQLTATEVDEVLKIAADAVRPRRLEAEVGKASTSSSGQTTQ